MSTRSGNTKSKKAMPTKYSAIGTTIVPLAQQMRGSTPKTAKDTSSTDNFFDDIIGDWDPPKSNPAPIQPPPPQNQTKIIGIHKQNDDVSSSSPSLSFTPTPPPNTIKTDATSAGKDRSIYILATNPMQPCAAPIPTHHTAPSQIPENSNYSRSIFDDIITEKPIQTTPNEDDHTELNAIAGSNDTVRDDPNYLPPPEEQTQSTSNGVGTRKENKRTDSEDESHDDDEEEDEEEEEDGDAEPASPTINPWAHLNKTVTPKITEAPIEEEDETENRVFLRHDAVDDEEENRYTRKGDHSKQERIKKGCYCLMFLLGIGVGVLLTIALIRHQAIDANYLFNTPSMETETDDVIQTEINNLNPVHNDTPTVVRYHRMKHHRMDASHESNMDDHELMLEVRGHHTPSPTVRPTQSPVSTNTPTVSPTVKPTVTPTMNPTHAPSQKSTTLSPTRNPSHLPTTSPIVDVIVSKSSKGESINVSNRTNITKGVSTIPPSDKNQTITTGDVIQNTPKVTTQSTTQSPTTQDTNHQIDSTANGTIDASQQEDVSSPATTQRIHHSNSTANATSSISIRNKNETVRAVNLTSSQVPKAEPKSLDAKQPTTESNPQTDNVSIQAPPHSTLPTHHKSNETEGIPSPHTVIDKNATVESNSDSNEQKDTVSSSILPLCNVVPQNQCTTNKDKPLPLPFDKPLSAQLRCHQNTCNSPPSLPGQRIISGETFEAGKTILDIHDEIPITCHTNHVERIKVHRDGYNNNEDWKFCLRISNDETLSKYPVLHITFSLIDFDLETGFDNLFFTTQFNEIYDDYAETWTGNWSTLHRFEPNTWYQNYWMTSSEPNAFSEFCLRLQSDESNVRKGFTAEFSITREIGAWSEWSECHAHSARSNLGNGACGIGVHSRVSQCPTDIQSQQHADSNKFEWSNGSHSCIHEYSNYPVHKYCIVADCSDIDNLKLNPTMDEPTAKYIFNGASRIDPQYADPFTITMNVGRKARDLNLYKLKEDLQSEIDTILSRYSLESQALFPDVLKYHQPIQFDKLGVRLLSSLVLGRVFTFVTTGSSNTAGHDNLFMSSYPMQLQSLMQVIWRKYSVYGGAFRVRNQAVGGHLGTLKQGPCISALIGTYDRNIDMISWESFMNDGSHINPLYPEIWLRNILSTYPREDNMMHSQPFITCISTGEGTQQGCQLSGRFVFNSFIRYYYAATGVANFYGNHVCQPSEICKEDELDGNGTVIPCWDRAVNEACRVSHISWHPSPHRHRVMAETFAVNFMRSAINAIDRLYDSMQNIDTLSSYELACLLEEYRMNGTAMNGTTSDPNHAVFDRPLTDVHTKCGELCRNGMWCAISFWPTPKHNQLHRYFVGNTGWFNNDTIDLPVDPLIMRNGGRSPIDHKAQWSVDKGKVGASLQIMVKVPTRYIMIVYPQGTSRTSINTYFAAFQFIVNGEKKECQGAPYDADIWAFCLLDCEKPGKYKLNIKLVDDTNAALGTTIQQYSIDEIAGI